MSLPILLSVVVAYLLCTGFLGWLGYRHTRGAADYLVGGRETHPVVMAVAYGSTFVSTSAIVGFGGTAALFGMGLLWLTALNILVGVFIAFVVFGRRTRALGAELDAHTFPELLGRRFQSRFIQGLTGGTIATLMPLYAAAVLIGGARFAQVQLQVDYDAALVMFALITVGYVLFGGIKGVIYTDAFQGAIMLAGMVTLLAVTYVTLGGPSSHAALTALAPSVPPGLVAQGHRGWTSMPAFASPLWWQLVSTIILGVGVGVLAQPQLTVRFMTVKSGRDLNRALVPGSIFILMMTGVAFVVGALSNLYFVRQRGQTALQVVADPVTGAPNIDLVIPTYVQSAMPEWFGYLFMLTLLAAAMSTLSAQFHVIGTAVGHDLFSEALTAGRHRARSLTISKLGVAGAFVATVILAFKLPPGVVAIATSLFFGVCAAAFLPAFVAALFVPRATRGGVIAGMLTGIVTWAFWVTFVHQRESAPLGLSMMLFGSPSLATGTMWAVVDPIVIALPLSSIVTVAGLLGRAPARAVPAGA
jgi:SSS family solute:Na+ symporter